MNISDLEESAMRVMIAHPVSLMTGEPFDDYSLFEVADGEITGSIADCFASPQEAADWAAAEGYIVMNPPVAAMN
jgi:hypothetical protein